MSSSAVQRTYTTGLSFKHLRRKDRRAARKRVAAIVLRMGKELADVCAKHSDYACERALQSLSKGEEKNGGEQQESRKTSSKGTFAAAELAAKQGDRSNLHQSAFFTLVSSSGEYAQRVKKLKELQCYLGTHQAEFLRYWLWEDRAPLLSHFSKVWKCSRSYVRSFLTGIRHRFLHHHSEMLSVRVRDPSKPAVQQAEERLFLAPTKLQWIQGLDEVQKKIDYSQSWGSRSYHQAVLKKLASKLEGLLPNIVPLLPKLPSGFEKLKEIVYARLLSPGAPLENEVAKSEHSRFLLLLRDILAHAYLAKPHSSTKLDREWVFPFAGWVREVTDTGVDPSKFLSKPFQKSELRAQPINLLMGPSYVVHRPGNSRELSRLLREEGEFCLIFKEPGNSWQSSSSVTAIVKASRKMRKVMEDPRVQLRMVRVLQAEGPSSDVDIQLVFKGPVEAFIGTAHLKAAPAEMPNKREQVCADTNRRGEFAIVTNLGIPIPDDIQEINRRWGERLEEVRNFKRLSDPSVTSNERRRAKYEMECHFKERACSRLRSSYHQHLVNWLGQLLLHSEAGALVLEDLNVDTWRTRKALAKAIESMADDLQDYQREVLAVKLVSSNTKLELSTRNPENSSRLHVGCGGTIQRSREHYDIAPCNKCKVWVNTHENAAFFLETDYLRSKAKDHTTRKDLEAHQASCLPYLGLENPPEVTSRGMSPCPPSTGTTGTCTERD